MRCCGSSLRSTASGVRCWGLLCDASQRTHFPPSEGAAFARPSLCASGRAGSVNLAHPEKACLLLGLDTKWGTKEVTSVSHGLAKVGDESFRLRPAITNQYRTQIASRGGAARSACCRSCGRLGVLAQSPDRILASRDAEGRSPTLTLRAERRRILASPINSSGGSL